MLKKSFKIAKCKTSLKLATSRIKLMKNKKGVQITQMKKELAQLLEAGDDRTARIRVEHVIREEKMVAAYDLIDIYCELIVARLPIIESQKNCPIDLKEAVTSVLFAALRCSDITELVDAKKQFTAKYGKEFVSAAIELGPDCGVSRMLVEKLSAVAPDVKTKVKVLSDIAKEHNINWDPTVFEEKESKPPNDLLNGPAYFEKPSSISVNSPKVETSNVSNGHNYNGNANQHVDFTHQNKRFTVDTQNVTGSFHKSFASSTFEDMKPSGSGSVTMNMTQSFHRNYSNSSSGKEKWNIEFKDATSAAQAAAESAELASFAARAAAELSSQGKIMRQYSTESYTRDHNPESQINISPKKSNSLRSRTDSVKENSVNHFESHGISSSKEGSSKSINVGQRSFVDRFKETTKYDSDDDSDSDYGPKYDMGLEYDEVEARSFFPSPDRDLVRIMVPSPKKNITGRVDSAKTVVKSHLSDSGDETVLSKSRSKKSTSRVKEFPLKTKTRIELNDLVETKSSSTGLKKSTSQVDPAYEESLHNTYDELYTGNDLKYGTLTGGLKNKGGLNYMKTPVKEERPVKVDPTYKNDRVETIAVQKSFKTRSQFSPPDKFFNNDESDYEEEVSPVSKQAYTGKPHLGPDLSRRTKGQAEPMGKTVISNPETTKSVPEPRRFRQETKPEPKISETKKIVESEKTESPKEMNLSFESKLGENNIRKPSHVHPKLPEYDSLAARIEVLNKMNKLFGE